MCFLISYRKTLFFFVTGVNAFVRKMIKLAKPKAVFKVENGEYVYKSVSSVRTISTKCRLGEEFIEDIPDGNQTNVKSKVLLELNKFTMKINLVNKLSQIYNNPQ